MPKSNDQKHFFIYALVRTDGKTDYHNVDMGQFEDVVSNAVYYGLTQNPKSQNVKWIYENVPSLRKRIEREG